MTDAAWTGKVAHMLSRTISTSGFLAQFKAQDQTWLCEAGTPMPFLAAQTIPDVGDQYPISLVQEGVVAVYRHRDDGGNSLLDLNSTGRRTSGHRNTSSAAMA